MRHFTSNVVELEPVDELSQRCHPFHTAVKPSYLERF